jgi:hypothetical protein
MRPEPVPSMVEFVRGALDSGHPAEMLSLVGVMVETLMPHEFSYPRDGERIDPTPHINAIAGMPFPEYAALLAVFAEMAVGDADLQGRCRNEVAFRSDALPLWIRELSKSEVYRAVRVVDAFGDSDQIMLGVRLADGHELACGVVIDHVGLSTVRDLGLWKAGLDTVLTRIEASQGDLDVVDIGLADARAWIEEGFKYDMIPLVEKCPGIRAVVWWLLTKLPEAGHPFDRRDHDWRAVSELVDEFFALPAGKRFDRVEFGDVLDSLMDQGTGNPMRWSAYRIRYTLSGFPDDFEEPLETVLRVPALLRAFVPFAHERSGIGAELTAQTLAMIDEVQKGFEERVRSGLQEYWDTAG